MDLTAFETITSLQNQLGEVLSKNAGVDALTLEHVAGSNRDITTYLAEWIRAQVLDDGTRPAGVKAHSKHGGGTCWAYWLREHDASGGRDPVDVLKTSEIKLHDMSLLYVLLKFGIDP